ncbi:MAG: hypothetical protein V3U02_04620 [Calditrichia bacterium]
MRNNTFQGNWTYDIKITEDQKKYAYWLIQQHDYGKRGKFDGDPERQYTGKLAEVVFADVMNLDRPVTTRSDDRGIDFVSPNGGIEKLKFNIDVKATGRVTPTLMEYSSNIIRSQVEKGLTDVYVFMGINKETSVAEFIGWIMKKELKPDWIAAEGSTFTRSNGSSFVFAIDTYLVPNTELYEFDPLYFWRALREIGDSI